MMIDNCAYVKTNAFNTTSSQCCAVAPFDVHLIALDKSYKRL